MRELSNPGASGSIFYITDDDEFIVKTVQRKEAEFLKKLLPGYYMVDTTWYTAGDNLQGVEISIFPLTLLVIITTVLMLLRSL